ncbi:MAG TPA: ATP-binding protein, partial [Candidatus Nanopelagicales bacterium]|nr:ATP-binding protein [Candidatus Nanopelagicales bacterium]
ERARRRHRTPGFLPAIGNIIRYQPFRPVAVSIVYVVTAIPREVSDFGWTIGLGLLITTVAFIFAIMLPLNRALERWPDHHVSIYLVGLVLIQTPTVLLNPLREQVTGEVSTAGALLVTTVFGSIVVIGTSSFGSWNRTRKEVIADFQREVNEDAIATLARGEALAKATMDVALVLHGSVQSQLHACAMTIDEAARNGDMVEVNRALMQARAILAQPDLDRIERQSRTLSELIDAQTAQWSGLLAVTVNTDPASSGMKGLRAEHVADIVEEAIANAVHHGAARAVSVWIAWEGEHLTITVQDNGSGPGEGSPGLGSRLFSSFGGRWELDARTDGAGGSVLTICLPTSHAAESFSR